MSDADRAASMGALPRASAHVVLEGAAFDGAASGGSLCLPDPVAHHLGRVLRLRAGETVTATDGAGRWVGATVPETFSSSATLTVTSAVRAVATPTPHLGVGIALTKGDKPELAVQKLTELGVDEIVLFAAEHSVVQWDATKAARNLERLRAVAHAAVEQSRSVFMPVVRFAALRDLAAAPGTVRADAQGRAPDPRTDRLLLVGPEGGWSAGERASVPDAVGFGGNVLRAETAAIVAGAIYASLRSGAVRPAR